MSTLSPKAEDTLRQIAEGTTSCHRFNRQILEKLRQSEYIKIIVNRKTGIPERLCRITEKGLRYLEEVTI
jgi:hypothetical protein